MTLTAVLLLALSFVFFGWRIQNSPETRESEKTGRGSTFLETGSSLFTVIGSGEYGFVVALIIAHGVLGTSFLLGLGLAFFAVSLIASRLRKKAADAIPTLLRFDGYTNYSTPDYFADQSGRFASILVTLVDLFAFLGILLVQFIVGGTILSHITDLSYTYSVILMACTVALYCSLGGFRALFHTDVIQGMLMWISLIAALIYLFIFSPQSDRLSSSLNNIFDVTQQTSADLFSSPEPIIIFLLTLAAAFAGPDVWQRTTTASSNRIARTALVGSGIALMVFGIVMLLFSADILLSPAADSDDAFLNYLDHAYGRASSELDTTNTNMADTSTEDTLNEQSSQSSSWPPFIAALFAIGLLSAFVSTADTSLILMLTLTQNELRRSGLWTFQLNDKQHNQPDGFTPQSKMLIVFYSSIGAVLALINPGVVTVFDFVISLLSLVGLPTLFILLGFGNKTIITLVLLIEILLMIFTTYAPSLGSAWWSLLPLTPAFLLLLFRRR